MLERAVLDIAGPLNADQLRAALKAEMPDAPTVRLTVRGPAATLRSVDLDRDLHYTQTKSPGSSLATGPRPAIIEADRFFCLGDNSPQSQDSRLWKHVHPWVDHLTGVEAGFVPRDLMLGRAFFVYFPAPWRVTRGSPAVIPNFGDMRFIE